MVRAAFVALLLGWVCHSAGILAADHAPGQFEHHPDVQISLFAQEPDIVDPVSLTFAANGDCFVVEMRDYPYGAGDNREGDARTHGGTIRLLRDRDNDGRADQSILFASGLSFPTSVMAWRDGVLVVAPPEIRFLRDTDGDDVADENIVVIKGLRRGVTDSNANGLRWGIDNRIHVVNGGNGGQVTMVGSDRGALTLGNSDFAFDIDRQEIVKTGRTGGGFGLVLDDFGHSFTTHNLDYLQQRIIPTRYLEQSPEMFSFKATENISDHGVSARIYPIVQATTRVNHPEQAGRFSSSGGMGILGRGPFSTRLANSVVVCDVVCNIVHRDVMRQQGPVFRASRAPEEQMSEFIASRDPAFRPVGLEHGPDGAIYLLDMQRDVIEHPDYIPARVRETLDIRAGHDRGRIYRLVPKDGLPSRVGADGDDVTLADRANDEIIPLLQSPLRWERQTAHRLLIERNDQTTVEGLRDTALHSDSPIARVRSMWILANLGTGSDLAIKSLDDPDGGVRENAILVLERHGIHRRSEIASRLVTKLADPDATVRFQAALSLDGSEHPNKQRALLQMLIQDHTSKWSRRAALLAVDQQSRSLLMQLWNSPEFQSLPENEMKSSLLAEVADVAAATKDDSSGFSEWLSGLDLAEFNPPLVRSLLAGLHAGWQRRPDGRLPTDRFIAIADRWASAASAGFQTELLDLVSLYGVDLPEPMKDLFVEMRRVAGDPQQAETSRASAIEVLGRDSDDRSFDLLIDLMSNPESTAIQQAAITAIGRMQRKESGDRLLAVWSSLLPGIRGAVIDLLLSRREYQQALLTALEQGEVQFSELNLDLEQRRRLLRWSSREIGRRAAKLFGDEEYSNRKEIVAHWLAKMPATGDPSIGRVVFQSKCASCHVVQEQGNRVGPDLQALSHRSVEDLLTHILDPNMSINPNYVSCLIESVDGQIFNGLLAEETADSVTLKQAEGKTVTIARDDIEQFKTLKTSLMPEGIEKEVSPEQMRSLIAYLQEN